MSLANDGRHPWEEAGPHQVTEGIYRLPLPLPGDGLRAVNVYAIEQPSGVVLIDSGWEIIEAEQQLAAGLGVLGHDLGAVSRILVTHVHRDHFELGLALRRRFGSRLEVGAGERSSLQSLIDPEDPSPLQVRLRQAGAGALLELLTEQRARRAAHGAPEEVRWGLPDHWLEDGHIIDLDGRRLEVLATPGHTQGHVVFVDREEGSLFSGDHVLPHITPSIGFEQVPRDSALADYLASLSLVRGLPDLRMLPAHGPVRPGTHARIDELLGHHEERLRATMDAVVGGASAHDVASALSWTRRERTFDELDTFNQMLAVNETAAHLDVLVDRGLLGSAQDKGIRRYSA